MLKPGPENSIRLFPLETRVDITSNPKENLHNGNTFAAQTQPLSRESTRIVRTPVIFMINTQYTK